MFLHCQQNFYPKRKKNLNKMSNNNVVQMEKDIEDATSASKIPPQKYTF